MAYLFLIPLLITLYLAVQGKEEKAFLYVFLPCLFVLPEYYAIRLPHLPPFSAAEGALLPIGVSLGLKSIGKWKFRRMDLWVALYLLSMGASELLREQDVKSGLLLYANTLIILIPAYIVGRRVIEPHLRLKTVKMIVMMLLALTPFILFEYRMGQSPWLLIGNTIFRLDEAWFVQMRGGHARIAAAFGDTILAGIVFAVVLLLNSWLVYVNKTGRLATLGANFAKYEKWHLPGFVLFGFLYLTQSRGPLMSVGVGFLILCIPRFRNMKIGAAIVGTILLIGGISAYSYFQSYTSVSEDKVTDERQSSAIYRVLLLQAYKPVVEAGGLLGYGILNHPTVNGQGSIDNNYLLIELSQGQLGFYTFLLIIGESGFTLLGFAARFRRREDTVFAYCMLGALTAVFFSLTTVYMGEQIPLITFFLLGWSQSLQEERVHNSAPEPVPTRFLFRRVLT
ncbi:O-antigen ligase family protein [Acidicapsa ligni]|uniref:O-antigen ligase family protein n=1 Tax=Acidicapsa ligni TaxID=542300 RepID=UPI0021E03030|nr:O-antigen ligase family protein [Acidicapsa ligni]